MTNIRITALRSAPARFQGQVRDLAVRWVLEETGTPYEMKLVGPAEQDSAAYRAPHPFGKVPAYEDGEVLRQLRHTALVSDIPVLSAYRDRCESRPAFQRALKAQLDAFTQELPAT